MNLFLLFIVLCSFRALIILSQVRTYRGINIRILSTFHLGVLFATAGFLDSIYLTYERLTGNAPDCGGGSSCAEIALGPLGAVAGVPISLLGVCFYAIMLTGWLGGFPRKWLFLDSLLGVIASLGFQGVSAAHRTFCVWCAFSAVCAFSLCIATFYVKPSKVRLGVFCASGAAAFAIFFVFAAAISGSTETDWLVDLQGLRWQELAPRGARHLGSNKDLPALVMFADFSCPKCKFQYRRVRDLVKRSHLRFVLRNFPHESERPSLPAAIAAESATGGEEYWRLCDALMANWFENERQLNQVLVAGRYRLGSSKVAATRVEADLEIAKRMGMKHTPTYLLCEEAGIRQIESKDVQVTIESYISR